MGDDCPYDSFHLFLGLSPELEVPTYISQITELLGTSGTQLGELGASCEDDWFVFIGFLFICYGWFLCRSCCSILYNPSRRDVFHRVLDFFADRDQTFFNPQSLDSDDQ